MDKYQIIKGPLVSEKSSKMVADHKYTFVVDKNANKIQIKEAVEEIFKVKVTKVNIVNSVPKAKKVGQYSGFKPAVTKAFVTLAEGYKIDIYAS